MRVDQEVSLVGERGRREEGIGPGGLDTAAERKVFGEEIVGFGAGVADAGLEVEDGDAGFAGFGEAGKGEEPDGEGVGLRVVGADEGEEGCLART